MLPAIIVASCSFASPLAALTSSGNGTVSDPYLVSNCTELQNMRDDLYAHYKLTKDIDCAAHSASPGFTPVGNGYDGGFHGSLNGDGFRIRNLTIYNDPAWNSSDLGLFGNLNMGSVTNLKITDSSVTGYATVGILAGSVRGNSTINRVSISNSTITGVIRVGGMAGFLDRSSVTDSSVVDSNVIGVNSSSESIGGLVGRVNTGTITKTSVSKGSVTTQSSEHADTIGGFIGHVMGSTKISDSYSSADVSGKEAVGGFVGTLELFPGGYIQNSYASGSVSGDRAIGGFVGQAQDGSIADSFAVGQVSATEGFGKYGGFIGATMFMPIDLANVYWDVSGANSTNCIGGGIPMNCTGVNYSNAEPDYFLNNHTNSPLDNWDFTNTWRVQSGDLPVLQSLPAYIDDIQIARTATTWTIIWNQADDGGSPITSYEIEWGASGSSNLTTVSDLSPSGRSYTLTGLSPGTRYFAQIRAVNAHGTGEWAGMYASTPVVPTQPTEPTPPVVTLASTVRPTIARGGIANLPTPAESSEDVAKTETPRPTNTTSSSEAKGSSIPATADIQSTTSKTSKYWIIIAAIAIGMLLVLTYKKRRHKSQ